MTIFIQALSSVLQIELLVNDVLKPLIYNDIEVLMNRF